MMKTEIGKPEVSSRDTKPATEMKKPLGFKVRVVSEAKISAGCTRFQVPSCGVGYRTT